LVQSRSSSNLSELLKIRSLLFESTKLDFVGFNWLAGRENNDLMYQFASTIGAQPSTMQTKIQAFIRFGFIRDNNMCPLQWTRVESLWNDLYSIGNYAAARNIYEINLTTSLAICAFTDTILGFSINPSDGELPLKTIFNIFDYNESKSLREFKAPVDGTKIGEAQNISYWKRDLINQDSFEKIIID
jgi:hypothetical protein